MKGVIAMTNKKLRVGDRVFVEQAWEDESGNYHDEYANIKAIDKNGNLSLEFNRQDITDFLATATYTEADVEKVQLNHSPTYEILSNKT